MSISQHVCAVIERETAQSVSEDTPLSDLNLDSLEFIELLAAIEDATDKHVPTESIADMQTVGDLIAEAAK